MSRFDLVLRGAKTAFLPGETVEGAVSFNLDAPTEAIEVRLVWFTMGKGTQDVSVVDSSRLEAPGGGGELPFSFTLPTAPHSFSGKLISLIWAVEALVLPTKLGSDNARIEFVMAPEGREIELPTEEELKSPAQIGFAARKAAYQAAKGQQTTGDSGMTIHK